MARSMKKTVIKSEPENIQKSTEIEQEVERVVEITKPKKKRVFQKDDLIKCHSIMSGRTFMDGIKTKDMYVFESLGAETEIAYQDLIAALNVNSVFLFKPFIIVDDEDFIAQSPKLKRFYDSMYSVKNLAQILSLSPARIKEELSKLPVGAKQSIRSIISDSIANGSLDSVAKIRAIDEFFGTQFMLLTGLYDN